MTCINCGSHPTELDHIIPRWRDGIDDISNLQELCRPCHKIKTHYDMERWRRMKLLVKIYINGFYLHRINSTTNDTFHILFDWFPAKERENIYLES